MLFIPRERENKIRGLKVNEIWMERKACFDRVERKEDGLFDIIFVE